VADTILNVKMKKDRDRHPCTLPYYRVTSLTVSLTVNVLLLVIRCCCSSDSRRILVIDAFSYTPAGRCKVSPTLRGSSCRPIVLFFATSSDGSDGNERAAVTATTNNSTKTATPQAVNGEDTTATTTNALVSFKQRLAITQGDEEESNQRSNARF
jgi:hypothetical protein